LVSEFYFILQIFFVSTEIKEMSLPHSSVTVNFHLNADASGNIEVFGQAPENPSDQVTCGINLPASDLSGLLRFWEPSSARGTRLAERQTNWAAATALQTDLAAIVNGSQDAVAAVPFSAYSDASHNSFSSFGELALGAMAHYLFGHVAATAAITNDTAFVAGINGEGASDSKIASTLKDAIDQMDASAALVVVEQVLGQDASRARDQDNNELAPDVKQDLAFWPGDIIFLQVTLKQPSVTVYSGVTAQNNAPSAGLVTEVTYSLKITLS